MPGPEAMQQTILLISDDINGRAAIRSILERHDASILIAENWQQCISSARFIRPDLIVIDITDIQFLQEGRAAICRLLKEQAETKDIPVIVTVGDREIEEKAEILNAGAEDVVTRPLVAEELSARVRVHLENRYLRKLLEKKRAGPEAANQSAFLLSDMSHDIRTPLNAIIGFTELLQQDRSLSPDNQERVSTIHRSGKHLSSLIDDLVEICRLQAGRSILNLTSFDLEAFASDIEKMIEQRTSGKPCRIIAPSAGNAIQFILSDRERLARVIMNLAEHAVKAVKSDEIHVRLYTVRDEGLYKLVGEISEDNTRNGANMLPVHGREDNQHRGERHGLIMARELLHCMGGSVHAVSDTKGERIRFELDVKEGSVQPAEKTVSHRSLIGGDNGEPIRVLVADDAEENCIVFTQILEHLGFDVRSVENGHEAVRQYEEWRPHIIMMDLRMPGMDGYEAARTIRTKQGGTDAVIFAATGDVLDSDKAKIRESGMNGYILKPYEEEAIREKIGEFVRIRASGQNGPLRLREDVSSENGSISALPHGLVGRMQDAARNARLDMLLGIVDESEAYNSGLAAKLRELIKRYDYESIFEILGIKQ